MTTDSNAIQNVVETPVAETPKAEQSVSPETPVATPPVVETPKVLTEERIAQIFQEQLKKALPSEIDPIKKQLRSNTDRTQFLKSKLADVVPSKIRAKVLETNPELENTIRLAEYEARQEAQTEIEREESTTQQTAEKNNQIQASLNELLADSGIDAKDPRIDWALDVTDYAAGLGRFNKSVAKILKDRDVESKTKEATRIKEMEAAIEARLRKSMGIESVNVGAPPIRDESVSKALDDYNNGLISTEDARKRGVKF